MPQFGVGSAMSVLIGSRLNAVSMSAGYRALELLRTAHVVPPSSCWPGVRGQWAIAKPVAPLIRALVAAPALLEWWLIPGDGSQLRSRHPCRLDAWLPGSVPCATDTRR